MYLIGYFSFMLICMWIAIQKLKTKWVVIGAIFQLCGLLGDLSTFYTNKTEMITKWTIYFALLIITIFIINTKKKKNHKSK